MTSPISTKTSRFSRRGFTLAEVLLTLCLLAAVAALCWPPIARMLDGQRLSKAADQVRSRWYQARIRAVDSDSTYLFQYVPGGGDYRVACFSAESSAADGFFRTETDDEATGTSAAGASIQGTLPEGVTFVAGGVAAEIPAPAVNSPADESPGATDWSDPILFFSDGTATSAKVTLVDRRGRAMEVALRGLTGVATVGDVFELQGATP